jgi:hypothetical protein
MQDQISGTAGLATLERVQPLGKQTALVEVGRPVRVALLFEEA